ncbi:MAG: hypothetical protein QGI17_12315, partial [Arenicellales bacterium]|nr:hypothetical protein [Arenicellales bacterium]
HSAIELLDAGYRVCVIEDATGSPWPHHLAGLRRMEQAGVAAPIPRVFITSGFGTFRVQGM